MTGYDCFGIKIHFEWTESEEKHQALINRVASIRRRRTIASRLKARIVIAQGILANLQRGGMLNDLSAASIRPA